MKKKVLSIVLAGTMLAAVAGCGSGETASSSSSKDKGASSASSEDKGSQSTSDAGSASSEGTFTVGFDQGFPPMGFVGEDGEYTGFDLELAAEVANRLNLEIKYQPIAWDSKDMELESGMIDCIWNGFTMNGREDSYAWSDAYMENDQVFVVRKDSGISSAADLEGKIVEVQADSSAEAALNDNQELVSSFGQLLTVADYLTAMMDLESGAVDAIGMDSVVASYQIQQTEKDFVILDDSIAAEQYGIGFKKDNTELRDKVQKVLNEMAADGTTEEISTKWFGKDITTFSK
ncbi:MAG TPA: amino acid ABC transporter substrate-binding protein [Candidatus Pelethocola excrementipullorum]|nr:amino acid ABC transporter substrate-binding protein [Candidatus Pelethocola excrementipullorum]